MSKTLEPCPNFIGGEWIESKTARTPVFNPSIGEVISECPVGNLADANALRFRRGWKRRPSNARGFWANSKC